MQLSALELRGKTLVTARHELRYAESTAGDHVNDDDGDTPAPDEALDAPDGDDDPSAAPLRLGVTLVAPPAAQAPAAIASQDRPGILLFRRMVRPG
jgi:hypothetical protein